MNDRNFTNTQLIFGSKEINGAFFFVGKMLGAFGTFYIW